MLINLRDLISNFENSFGGTTIIYVCNRELSKSIDRSDISVLIDCLRSLPQSKEAVNLILNLPGGDVNSAFRIGSILKSETKNFRVFVPFRAWSAATIICLAADELILGKYSELTPIDPQYRANGNIEPFNVSPNDLLSIRTMASEWFGLSSEPVTAEIFITIIQRIFPATVGNFYRSFEQIRENCKHFLRKHYTDTQTQAIVDLFLNQKYLHDYIFSHEQLLEVGLKFKNPTVNLEKDLWDMVLYIQNTLSSISDSQKKYCAMLATKEKVWMSRIVTAETGMNLADWEESVYSETV